MSPIHVLHHCDDLSYTTLPPSTGLKPAGTLKGFVLGLSNVIVIPDMKPVAGCIVGSTSSHGRVTDICIASIARPTVGTLLGNFLVEVQWWWLACVRTGLAGQAVELFWAAGHHLTLEMLCSHFVRVKAAGTFGFCIHSALATFQTRIRDWTLPCAFPTPDLQAAQTDSGIYQSGH